VCKLQRISYFMRWLFELKNRGVRRTVRILRAEGTPPAVALPEIDITTKPLLSLPPCKGRQKDKNYEYTANNFTRCLFSDPTWAVPELRRIVTGFPPRRPGFDTRSCHAWDLWWTKCYWRRCSPSTSLFLFQFSFNRLLRIHHLSSGPGIVGQFVSDIPIGLGLTHPTKRKKKTN
jgi:hypothetical protein